MRRLLLIFVTVTLLGVGTIIKVRSLSRTAWTGSVVAVKRDPACDNRSINPAMGPSLPRRDA